MIKGVNKQVLEVTNTENPYFEVNRALVSRSYIFELRYFIGQGLLCTGAGVAIMYLLGRFG